MCPPDPWPCPPDMVMYRLYSNLDVTRGVPFNASFGGEVHAMFSSWPWQLPAPRCREAVGLTREHGFVRDASFLLAGRFEDPFVTLCLQVPVPHISLPP